MRRVVIDAVLNGWIVTCGCQKVVFDPDTKLCEALGEYIKDTAATEKKWLETSCNRYLYNSTCPGTPADHGRDAQPEVNNVVYNVQLQPARLDDAQKL